jgi:hypothetical protein
MMMLEYDFLVLKRMHWSCWFALLAISFHFKVSFSIEQETK